MSESGRIGERLGQLTEHSNWTVLLLYGLERSGMKISNYSGKPFVELVSICGFSIVFVCGTPKFIHCNYKTKLLFTKVLRLLSLIDYPVSGQLPALSFIRANEPQHEKLN